MYYESVKSPEDLVGVEGFLRLPAYIFDEYVFDENRREALQKAITALRDGRNVLILGKAGTGKTALLAMILKRLMDMGYMVAKIINGEIVKREHEERGIVLFYDDIPRMEKRTLVSIADCRVRMIVATARIEELDELSRKMRCRPEEVFVIIEIREMRDEDLRTILERFARREGIEVVPRAAEIVVSKARSLPVYIWQVIRDLTIARREVLDEEFAMRIPEGMLEYVDRILWDVLGESEDRREVLLTLMLMTNMPEYEMHQDLFNAVFVEATKEIKGIEAPSKAILLRSDTLDKVCRYLARTPRYSFRLPHDSWADVLRGHSRGLLSKEISSLVYTFPLDEQMRILKNAAKRAYEESIARSRDPDRIREFFRQINLLGFGGELFGEKATVRPAILKVEREEEVPEQPPEIVTEEEVSPPVVPQVSERVVMRLYATSRHVKSRRIDPYSPPLRLSEISRAILWSRTYMSLCGLSESEALRRVMYRKIGKTWTIKYPCWGNLSVTETIETIAGKPEDEKWKGFFFWLFIGFFMLLIPVVGVFIFLIFLFLALSQLMGPEYYLSEILIEGDRSTVISLARDIRAGIGRRPIHRVPTVVRFLERKLGVSVDALEKQWYVL